MRLREDRSEVSAAGAWGGLHPATTGRAALARRTPPYNFSLVFRKRSQSITEML